MSVRLFFCLALSAAVVCSAAGVAPGIATAKQLLNNLPVRFEPNRGQWNPRIKYFARAGESRLLLTAHEAVLSVGGQSVGLSLQHSNPGARVEGLDPLAARANYFVGRDRQQWQTAVEQYGRVRYADVYPGTDLIYYGRQDRLEYDLVLRPGADVGRIRLKFRGARHLRITPEGDLALSTGDSDLIQKRPVIYQETASGSRQSVEGRYRLLGRNLVGVELAAYDRTRALTIDPVLVYSSLVGGSGSDAVIGVKLDRQGSVWVAGYTSTGDLQGIGDVYQGASGGGTNIFIAKINPNNDFTTSMSYFTYIGGSGVDMPNAMAMDGAGNIYLTGSTTSTNFPLGGSSFENGLTSGTGTDAFVIKFNPGASGAAQMVYSTYLGGSDTDVGYGIDVDAAGLIYVIGTTKSGDFPIVNGYAGVLYGPQDAFVAKFDLTAAQNLVYSTYLGGELLDEGRAIAVTPSGTVYVAGSTESTGFPQAGNQYQGALSGAFDIWLARMDLTQAGVGSLIYSTYLGGSDLDDVRKLAIDPSGKVLLTGYTLSTDFPVTGGAFQKTLGGSNDAFVAKINTANAGAAALAYSSYVGSSGMHVGYGLAVGPDGSIYIGGLTSIQDIFVTNNANQVNFGGGLSDGFVIVVGP